MSNGEEKEQHIRVTVDNEQTKALAEELARERLRNEKLVDTLAKKELKEELSGTVEEKQEQKLNLAEKRQEMYEKTGESRYLNCKTVAEMADLTSELFRETVARRKGTPSGSAPIEGNYPREQLTFRDYKSMVEYCKSHPDELVTNSLTGREVINELWKRSLQTIKSGQTIQGYSPDGEAPQKDTGGQVTVTLGEGMKNNPNSDIQQLLQKSIERERQKIIVARERTVALAEKKRENQK